VYVGRNFRDFYASKVLATDIRTAWASWLIGGEGPAGDPPVDLGPNAVQLVCGPALRLDGIPTTIDLTTADPLALPVEPASAIVALLVLHHFPDPDAQDEALAAWAKALRPNGVLIGLNPIDGPHFRSLDVERRCAPVDPMTFDSRLAKAGFGDVTVRVWSLVGFTARR
jgi:SAM-dependent methyltransferase